MQCGSADGDPLPEARPFEPYLRPEDASLDVFVGVTSEGTSNVAPAGEPVSLQRFGRVPRSTDDFNTGGAAQELEYASANVRILFGGERRD